MTKQQMLQGAILSNRSIQQQARTLNVRAGEVVFPVWTREEWQSWLGTRLKGAISAETLDVDDILLPQLPVDEIQLLMDMNPDTIEIFGKGVAVEYREPYYGTPRLPQVRLRGEFVSQALWNKLPDEGVKLPGGRTVSVLVISDNGYTLAEGGDIPALKLEVKNQLNRAQWNEWTDRPTIVVPTTIDDATVLPEITTAVYGKCVVTGDSLEAFGTLTSSRYWSSDPIVWKTEWFRVRVEAEAAFSKAQAELEKTKVEARDKREREAVQKTAEAVKSRAKDLYGEHCSYSSEIKLEEGDLRDRLYSLYYAYLPSDLTELREWTAQTNTLIAEVEVAVAEAQQKHGEKLAEEARLLAEGEKQFGGIPEQLLTAFHGNKATTLAFMQKVAQLPTTRLNQHEVGCGRERRRRHLIEVSGDEEFFLGADPNNVSWYVAKIHFDGERYLDPAPVVQNSVAVTSPAQPATLDDLAAKWGARRR